MCTHLKFLESLSVCYGDVKACGTFFKNCKYAIEVLLLAHTLLCYCGNHDVTDVQT